jgi:DNA topoisomerase III
MRSEFHPLDAVCPRCGGGPFSESFKAYECASGCKAIVWKIMAGREFERDEVVKLLIEGRVGPLQGFRSKLGQSFSAVVVLDEKSEWMQRFDFEKE